MAYLSAAETLVALNSTKTATQGNAALPAGVPDSPTTYATAALVIYLIVVLATVLSQVLRPRLTAAIACLVPIAIFTIAAIASGELAAALAACAILAASWMAGDIALRLFRAPTMHVSWGALTAAQIALGLGCLGTAVLLLGSISEISLLPIVSLALVISLAWSWTRWRSPRDSFSPTPGFSWAMPRLDWFESILIALSAAFFVFAALAALTPESILTASDSVRQHLPQAREIWQDHAVLVYPTIETPSASVLGASLNAVAYGFGGFTTVRILQVLVSLCCLIAIAGLGSTLAGKRAGIVGAAFFSAMPLVLWLSGHAYPDMLAVLFVCSAVQCIVFWQNDGNVRWLLASGVLAGFSLATKQISAVMIVAIFIALAISARPGAGIVERLRAILMLSVACLLTLAPWFVRSAALTGTFPLLGTIVRQLANVPVLHNLSSWLPLSAWTDISAEPIESVSGTLSGGVARTFPGILAGPWDLTFNGAYANFQSVRHGEFGILLLMFLPLVLVNICSRATVLIAVTAAVSFVGWVFTIQVPRHLLPSLAMLAVLAGISVANADKVRSDSHRLSLGRFVQVAAVLGLVLTPLFFLPNPTTGFPVSVLTGATRPENYLARVDPATTALLAATTLLPADTPVGYIGQWQGAQSSTEARLIYLGQYSADETRSLDTQAGDSPEAILESFDRWGIGYFIWDRPDTRPQDVESSLLSGDFLLHYTSILGGDNGIYLFKVHPSGVPDPTAGKNLLQDPEFASLRKSGNVWNGSRRDLADNGVFQPRRQMPVSQRVEVTPGKPYLLVLHGSCSSARDRVQLSLTWQDDDGTIVSTTADELTLGSNPNTALMWRNAPEGASAVDVGIATASGTPCLVRSIGMYEYESP